MILSSGLHSDIRIALRNVLRHRRRSLVAIAAIASGVIAMMLAAGFIEWIYWANRELSTVNQLGHIQIARPGFHDHGQADPHAYLMPKDVPALQAVRSIPGVIAIAPRVLVNGLISHGEKTLAFLGEGIDPSHDPSSDNLIIVDGRLPDTRDPQGIVLGAGLAAELGVKVGDTVVLLTNTPSGGMNAVEGTIRAVVSISIKAFDDNVLRMPVDMARGLLRISGSHVWVVRLEHTDLTDTVATQLKALPDLHGYDVIPWHHLADFYNKLVKLFSRQVDVVILIISALIMLGIANTMTMSVIERTSEIGTAMALGLRRQRILRLFLLEGGVLGLSGGLLGIGLGWLGAALISTIGIPMPPGPGMSRGYVAGILITPEILAQALLLSLPTSLAASLYPAWRASRLTIVDALRHNR